MARGKKTLQETVQKDYPDFVETVQGLQLSDLEKRLSTYAKELNKTEEAKESDEKLKEAQAIATEYGAPYKDAKKAIKLKSKYIISLIKEKGGDA